jgi:hypothetical protein
MCCSKLIIISSFITGGSGGVHEYFSHDERPARPIASTAEANTLKNLSFLVIIIFIVI